MATTHSVPVSPIPQLDLKHILVTTDFSEFSRMALKQAIAIARLHGSDLTLLHLMPPEPVIYSALEPNAYAAELDRDRLLPQIEELEEEEGLSSVPHQFLVERGALEDVLQKVVDERHISMLMLGTHGRSGLRKVFLGSIAEEIFRMASCPVMTVGPEISSQLLTHGKFRSILFATDFSAGSKQALPYAIGFAQESQARLIMLHVLEEQSVTAMYLHDQLMKDARQQLTEMVPPQSMLASTDFELVNGYPVESILRVAQQHDADLIVLGVHKSRGFGARASAHLPWTIAHSVVCHAKCPVLTVRG
jgi:nucleotide-binding universal stress UspA family protein